MNYGAIEAAYRKFFGPRWDKMTPEQKANIDPETAGKIESGVYAEKEKRDIAYQKGWTAERERRKPRVIGTSASTWG